MNNDILKVAKWEFTKGIKNKTFLFMTFFLPIVMIVIGGVVGYFSSQTGEGKDLQLGIIDKTEFMRPLLEKSFSEEDFQAEFLPVSDENKIEDRLEDDGLDGVLVIPENVVETNQVQYYFKELSGMETGFIKETLSSILVDKRLIASGYSPEEINSLTRRVSIKTTSLKEEKGESKEASMVTMFMPFGLAMLMVFGTFMSGTILMQSIIKEKGNKITEILFSAISARTLMIGKVMGYALLSLVQIAIWLTVALVGVIYFFHPPLTALFNFKILLMVLYLAFGFIIVSSVNGIVGSTMKDAQSGNQSSGLFILIPIIPIYFSAAIINSPSGVVSRVLSYIPLFTPTTMMLRLGFSTPPTWELGLTFLILVITAYLMVLLASKIFRIGMLMYGKTPDLKEIIKWARSKSY